MTQINEWTRISWKGLLLYAALILPACQPPEPEYVIEVQTGALIDIGSSFCQVEGEIISVGETGISSHGFVWSAQPDPTLEKGSKIDLGESYTAGTFGYKITGLTATTIYYVKAYAAGGGKTVYGVEKTFTTGELTVPALVTFSVSDYTATGGFSGGNITDHGGGEVYASGICWSEGRFPDLNDPHTDEGGGHSFFESYMSGLEPYTLYHVRAYATNGAGTGYGQEVEFVTYWDNAPVVDWDGNEYPTVQIGEQVWTAMNLRSTHFADGTPVELVEADEDWNILEIDAGAYCFYDNSDLQAEPYGALYNWSAAANTAGSGAETSSVTQGVCPDGWHLPRDEEWKILEMELGMSQILANEDQWRGWDEGGKMKVSGTDFWNEPNEMATNESGFSAVPAGFRSNDGTFSNKGDFTVFWSSTAVGDTEAWNRGLHTQRGDIKREPGHRNAGYSVRCIKDY